VFIVNSLMSKNKKANTTSTDTRVDSKNQSTSDHDRMNVGL